MAGVPGFGTGAGGAAWAVPWWQQAASSRHRLPYAFLAFAPDFTQERIFGLSHGSVSTARGWAQYQTREYTGQTGLLSWRHTPSGAVLSLFIAGSYPLIAVMAPGDPTTDPVRALGLGVVPGRAARLAVRRFVNAARSEGGRMVVTAQLPALVEASTARGTQSAAIEARLAEIAEADRFRTCPRCDSGCDPALRWCPRCEYEFTHADDHGRDQAVLQRRQEAEGLGRTLAHLLALSFPAVAIGAPGQMPVPAWGARR